MCRMLGELAMGAVVCGMIAVPPALLGLVVLGLMEARGRDSAQAARGCGIGWSVGAAATISLFLGIEAYNPGGSAQGELVAVPIIWGAILVGFGIGAAGTAADDRCCRAPDCPESGAAAPSPAQMQAAPEDQECPRGPSA